jgi:hypothetical protein
MVPPPPSPPLFGREDEARSTNANSSPTASAHAICRALKACTLLDQPLPTSLAWAKDGKGNCGDNNGNDGGNG